MTFAGEKAMSDISDRIYKARISLLRLNIQPSAVYLGYEDEADLLTGAESWRVVELHRGPSDTRARVFGLPVYVVDEARHLRVV
jgi:hypothetical protein